MDPELALRDLRMAIQTCHTHSYATPEGCLAAEVAIEHTTALDAWMSNGGFPPAEWHSDSNDQTSTAT